MGQFSDHSLQPRVTLVFGRSGSGKTTFAFRYLVNALTPQDANPEPAACIFVFDWKLEASRRLGLPAVGTEHGCEAALASRAVIFNPNVMFTSAPGQPPADKRAFAWFCNWVFAVAQRGPGRKILFVDELWKFVEARADMVPFELQAILREGRAENLELLTATQFPKDYARPIRASVTEWVCFNTEDPDDLAAVRGYFSAVDEAATLPRGQFVAFNRDTRAVLRGKLF